MPHPLLAVIGRKRGSASHLGTETAEYAIALDG
jgi:hypothetical protein